MHDPRESFRPSPPVILDFDGSVLPVAEGERRIPLGPWQEAIRFGCTRRAFSALEAHLEGVLPVDCGCAFMGSGDFHHVTLIPLRRLCRRLPPASLDVVVFDNHPDNMRYPFGIHCGGCRTPPCCRASGASMSSASPRGTSALPTRGRTA